MQNHFYRKEDFWFCQPRHPFWRRRWDVFFELWPPTDRATIVYVGGDPLVGRNGKDGGLWIMRSEISPPLLAFFSEWKPLRRESRLSLLASREGKREERNGSVKECDLYFLTSTVVAAVKFPTHVVFPFASRLIPPPEILFQVFFSFHLPNGKLLLSPSFLSSFSFVCRVWEKKTRGGFCCGLGRGVTGQEKNWNSGQFFFVYLQQGLGRWHQTVIILRCRNRRRCLDHRNSKVIYPLRQHRRRGEEEKGDNKSRNSRVLFCPSLANHTRTLSFHLFEQDTKHVQYVCSGTLDAPSPALYWWNHTFYFQDVSIWFLDCAQTLKSTKRKVTSRVLPDAIGIRPKKPTLLLLLFKEHYFS